MGKIRYLAAMTYEPDRLAAFYSGFFGMREFARSPEGDVSLTDGYFNLTFLRIRRELRALEPRVGVGLNHLGLEVESIEKTVERYLAYNPKGIVRPEPGGPHHGEMRIYDPEFMPVSLSEKGFGVTTREATMPHLLHVAMNSFDPPRTMDFYERVFDLRPIAKTNDYFARQGLDNKFMVDGAVNLALHSYYRGLNEGHQGSYGINHFGFMVEDWKTLMADIGRDHVAAPRPADRPYEDARIEDPDGNMVDLGETKGWEIELDVRVFPPGRSLAEIYTTA
jgi:catechol 2,3-dioxygenase-like lactoylglutathione lyase family enzyme